MDPTVLTAIVGFVGVIIGGIISTIGPWLLAQRQEKADLKKRRAEKLEELVAVLYEHKHWLDIMEAIRVFGEVGSKPMSPFSKAEAIATVHFPQFLPQLTELEIASSDYELWMLKASQKRVATGKADGSGHKEAYESYATKRGAMLKGLRDYAKSEFNK